MNANELADSLMGWADDVYGGGETLIEAATMLRKQQAEIEALHLELDRAYKRMMLQQAEIEALEQSKDRLIKTMLFIENAEPVAWMQDRSDLYVSDRPDDYHTIALYKYPKKELLK